MIFRITVLADGMTVLFHNSRQVGHDPGRAIDIKIARRLMKNGEKRIFNCRIVKFSIRIDFARE